MMQKVHFRLTSVAQKRCCLSSPVLTDGGDVKRTDQNTIHYSKIVTFLATKHSRSRASILSVSVGDQKVSGSGFFLT